MPCNEDIIWPEIECQLDEILLQVSSGIPEECVMRSIGVPFSEWASFKVRRMNASAPLIQYLRCDMYDNLYDFDIKSTSFDDSTLWMAAEQDFGNGYTFFYSARVDEDSRDSFKALYRKVEDGLSRKSLMTFNAGKVAGYADLGSDIGLGMERLGIAKNGVARITGDERSPFLIIDGKRIECDEFIEMLAAYEGFDFEWSIEPLAEEYDVWGMDMSA